MAFKSVNEIYNFDFQDAQIVDFKQNNEGINFNIEALIIEPENSQNENYTKSYADTVRVHLANAKIISAVKCGYKKYDANNKLVEEVPDKLIENEALKIILKASVGAYLFAMDANPESNEEMFSYDISLEFPSKEEYDNIGSQIYTIKVNFTKSVFEWDRYKNRVN